MARTGDHLRRVPRYPDPRFFFNRTQKYFFRNAALRHLRMGQFVRYFCEASYYIWYSMYLFAKHSNTYQ